MMVKNIRDMSGIYLVNVHLHNIIDGFMFNSSSITSNITISNVWT